MLSASSYGHFTAAKEFRSQCHIFRFGNIGYCCEIDIFMDQNIAYCCEIDIFIDQNIAYCCEIDISRLKKAALGDFSGSPGFLRIPPGSHRIPPGIHRGSRGDFRESSQPVLGGVWGGYVWLSVLSLVAIEKIAVELSGKYV